MWKNITIRRPGFLIETNWIEKFKSCFQVNKWPSVEFLRLFRPFVIQFRPVFKSLENSHVLAFNLILLEAVIGKRCPFHSFSSFLHTISSYNFNHENTRESTTNENAQDSAKSQSRIQYVKYLLNKERRVWNLKIYTEIYHFSAQVLLQL